MAYTASFIVKTVVGNERQHIIHVSADGASGSVDTGLDYIYGAQAAPISMSTAAPRVKRNVNSGGTAANGFVLFSGCASTDEIMLIVYGR